MEHTTSPCVPFIGTPQPHTPHTHTPAPVMWCDACCMYVCVGVYLKDLVVLAESPTTLPDHPHLIHYDKFRVAAGILRSVQACQHPTRAAYPFEPHPVLYDMLQALSSTLPPDDLMALSKSLEP